MTGPSTDAPVPAVVDAWADARLAAAVAAVDPAGIGGVVVRASAGPARDAWLAGWRALLDPSTPVGRVPLHVDDARLAGGIDLAASLRTGTRVREAGLFERLDGGFAILAMAERIAPATAGRIAAIVDGVGDRPALRVGLVALDEGDADERVPASLDDRIGLSIDLHAIGRDAWANDDRPARLASDVDAARGRLADVRVDERLVGALCATAAVLGIDSSRPPLQAVRVTRVVAALAGRDEATDADAATAARLVLAPRARRLPPAEAEAATDTPPPDESADAGAGADASDPPAPEPSRPRDDDGRDADPGDRGEPDAPDAAADAAALDGLVLEAAVAAMPPGLLDALARGASMHRSRRPAHAARDGAGASGRHGARGIPAGVRRGRPRPPERLSVVETLRAAAPWQRLRRAEDAVRDGMRPVTRVTRDATRDAARDDARPGRVRVRIDDLHVVRRRQRRGTTTVFVVDASGSSALHRLAEAKGAVELLLADCYVRRDRVAVLAFRGRAAELLLPPTRSLVRARRSLAGLPGGGGTPLASALDALRELLVGLHRHGDTALAVLLTDGSGNVGRDGRGGRAQAEADALSAARALRALDVDAVLIDTSPQPQARAARLADAMGASYRPLPHAGARELSALVRDRARRA